MPFPLDCAVSAGSGRLDYDSIDWPQKYVPWMNPCLGWNLLRCGLPFILGLNSLAGEIACRPRCFGQSLKNILRFSQMYLTMCGKKRLFLFAPSSFFLFFYFPQWRAENQFWLWHLDLLIVVLSLWEYCFSSCWPFSQRIWGLLK